MPEPALIATTIDGVTVYRRGAEVDRSGTVNGAAATSRWWRCTGLPLGLDDQSVQVVVQTETGTAPVITDLRVVLVAADPDAPFSSPDTTAMDGLRDELHALRSEDADLAALLELLTDMKYQQRGAGKRLGDEPLAATPIDARLAFADWRYQRSSAAAARRAAIARAIADCEERLAALKAALDRATSDRPPTRATLSKQIELRLRPGTAETVQLAVRYRVPAARWCPSYRLDLANGRGQLVLGAHIAQATGEDWGQVAVTCSTAEPQAWRDLPKPGSIRIGRAQPPPPSAGWREPPAGVAALYQDYDQAFGQPRAAVKRPTDEGTQYHTRGDLDDDPWSESPPAGAQPPEPGTDDFLVDALMVGGAPPPTGQVLSEEAYEAMAAPPPPMPAAAPMSASAPSKQRRRSAPGGPPPPGAPAPMAAPPPPPPPPRPDRDLLAFANLHLTASDASQRGSLQMHEQAHELGWMALISPEHWSAAASVMSDQRRDMTALEQRTLPAGTVEPALINGFATSYPGQGRVSVPSDGHWHHQVLDAIAANVALHHVTVPGVDQQVYRQLRLTNPLSQPLAAGPVDIQEDGVHLLTGSVPVTATAGAMAIDLGVEDRIRVARNLAFHEQKAGMTGGRLALVHELSVEVRNLTGSAVSVEVRERLPHILEDSKDIDISVTEVVPAWRTFEQADRPLAAGHAWDLAVPAGESVTASLTYTITISAKCELAGGNRRDA